ncbi:FAS1-like dehydratase domain-containing protein [Pseudonocardia pini]|uniref:FAS1-like dehydratase domain-containing protein n=1 Tax=Pseudonocardia pini TaxID=2758030 RepID=UPI0015F024EF|nr:MaoC family dehydratase N-terminal domain-containing protein [Pseudonocardia pini]
MSDLVREAATRCRALVGSGGSRPLGVLDRLAIERFASAVGAGADRRPTSATGRVSAHPLHVPAVVGWTGGPPTEGLRDDGSAAAVVDELPLTGLRLMGAGQDLEFHRTIEEGTAVTVETTVESVELKNSSTGEMLLLTFRHLFSDDQGQPLVTCRESLIAR